MTNKPNAIDKWRERVLISGSNLITAQSWVKSHEKQIAILRVAIPFLTDSQIRGKAWYICGFNSIMGAMPRSGLTPETKKEFSKHKVHSSLKNMPRKLRKEKSADQSPPVLDLSRGHDIENNSPTINKQETDFLGGSYTPMSGVNMLSNVSNEVKKRGTKRKRKNSAIIKSIKVTDTIVKETLESSLGSGAKTFYCSQTLVGRRDPSIMQAVVPSLVRDPTCYTQPDISQCSTTQTGFGSKTASGLDVGDNDTQLSQYKDLLLQKMDVPPKNLMDLEHNDVQVPILGHAMSQLYDSQALAEEEDEPVNSKIQENILTQLYDSNSFAMRKPQSSSSTLNQNRPTASNSIYSNVPNNLQNQECILTQLYDSNSFIGQNLQCSSNALRQNTPAASNDIYNNMPNNLQNQDCILTQLYDSNSFLAQKIQSSSNTLYQNTVAASNSIKNNLTQLQQRTDGSAVEVAEDLSGWSQPNSNKQQNFNIGQTTPVRCTNVNQTRQKIAFAALAEGNQSNGHEVEDNFSGTSVNNEASCKGNSLPSTATSFTQVSMINNPPTEFTNHVKTNFFYNHQHQIDADFLEESESAAPSIDTQKICESFASSPDDADPLMLPPTLLLSNYCSEYDKAYTMKDLKPNQYRHYHQHEAMRSLKEYLDTLIPIDMSIKERFKITNLP